jgi:hypothetical protein
LIRLSVLRTEHGDDPIEHAQPSPADEPVADRLVRTISSRRGPPAQPISDPRLGSVIKV